MRIIVIAWTGICCLAVWAVAGVAVDPRYATWLETSQDQIVRSVVVPSAERPQGEVQLIRRNELLVVQTLLASRILKRVVAAIDAKEKRSWPEDRQGAVASRRYREELFRATEQAWEAFRQRSDRQQKRQMLAIEFIIGAEKSLIALSLPQVEGDYGLLRLVDKRLLKVWRVSGNYVRENVLEIIADSFNLDEAEAQKLLKQLQERSEPGE